MSDTPQMFTRFPYSSAQNGWQHRISPPCLLTGCVTVSIHHPDMGALIETACLDPVSG